MEFRNLLQKAGFVFAFVLGMSLTALGKTFGLVTAAPFSRLIPGEASNPIADGFRVSANQGLYWKQGWINLSSYGNLVNTRLVFRAVTGSGETSDIAIDAVFVGSLVPIVGCSETTANNYNANVNINNNSSDDSYPAGQSILRISTVKDNYTP